MARKARRKGGQAPLPDEDAKFEPLGKSEKRRPKITGPCFCKFLVPHHLAGILIGRDGRAVAEIEALSRCHLEISDSETQFPGTRDRMCIVDGLSLEGIETAMRTIVELMQEENTRKRCVLKLIVPMSAASSIIGNGGDRIKRIYASTGCSINLSHRVDGFQERLLTMRGEGSPFCEAAQEVLQTIQEDVHLQEHMHFDYSQTLPQGAWSGESMEPAEPEYPLMTMEIAKTKTKKEVIVYLQRAAPRNVLVEHCLLGCVKNVVKATNLSTLIEVVQEVWELRGDKHSGPRELPTELRSPLQPGLQSGSACESGAGLATDGQALVSRAVVSETEEAGQPEEEPNPVDRIRTQLKPKPAGLVQPVTNVSVTEESESDKEDGEQANGFIQSFADALANCLFGHRPQSSMQHEPLARAVHRQSPKLGRCEDTLLGMADSINGVPPCVEVPVTGGIYHRMGYEGAEETRLLHQSFLQVENIKATLQSGIAPLTGHQ